MVLRQDALQALEETSRTFFLPIQRLPEGLQEAVGSGYLCMRAIDEIEDHTEIEASVKAHLLQGISLIFQAQTFVETFAHDQLEALFENYKNVLPEVTTRLGEWACLAPRFIAPRIWEATAAMSDRMAHWAANGFKVITEADLDRYTYGVAGAVGLMLSDLFAWFENLQIDRSHAIQFGRGLQATNILRNHAEDVQRGVEFYPDGWTDQDMFDYARRNLDQFGEYAAQIPETSFIKFVAIPRALAYATLDALARGQEKLTRTEVVEIVQQLETDAAA